MMRNLPSFVLAAAALAAPAAAQAQQQVLQTQSTVSPVLEVERLAPQLVQFTGSDVNFQNLVNGLSFGVPVTLTTAVAPGVNQVVTFTPSGTMTPLQIAQLLVTAQQAAIANGIATPTAEQLGVLLNGGALPTATGTTQVNGLIAGGTTPGSVATQTTPAATQMSPAAALQSTRPFSISNSPLPRGVADSPAGPTTSAPLATTVPPATGTIGTIAPSPAAGATTGAVGNGAAAPLLGAGR